ncbi:MAG: CoA transferase [Gracilibacteraceae bacterium]|jgi:crotonobetainyl-CoA:carnitine CoA-transferase CaiB-like acyl-CoA transferase|nr:CoA transferase [Gracilibacteraceae bacterium]
MGKPLEGIRIVELATHLAAPIAARVFADWGAYVVKVEPPEGEPWRTMGAALGVPVRKDHNPAFQTPNINKESIALNLKSPEGTQILHKLLEQADIFLTNTRPRALTKLGFDYETLKDKYPRLIYAHFGGFGDLGPDRDRPGFDLAAFWCRAGTPVEWTMEGNTPFKAQGGFGDAACGALLTAALLTALISRDKTGKGDFIRVSLYGSALWFNSNGLVTSYPEYGLKFPKSVEDLVAPNSPLYQSKDGDWFMVSIPDWNKGYAKTLSMLSLDKYLEDENFTSVTGFKKNPRRVTEIMQKEGYGQLSTAELEDRLIKGDFVFQRLVNPAEVHNDEQAWANDFLRKVTLEDGKNTNLPNNPVKFASFEPGFSLAPQLGANTRSVLREIGYDEAAIDALIAGGAVK